MYLGTFQNKSSHRLEFDSSMRGILLKMTSQEGDIDVIDNVKVSVELQSPGNRRIAITPPTSVNDYGLLTSLDSQNNNQFNIDIRPTEIATKGYTYWRMLNLTPDGNLELREDEKLIYTLTGTDGFVIEIDTVVSTFSTNRILTFESEEIQAGTNVLFNCRRGHSLLLHDLIAEDQIIINYADNSSIRKGSNELKFMSMTSDMVATREIVSNDRYVKDLNSVTEHQVLDLTGDNPILSIEFENVQSDTIITQLVVKARQGDGVVELPKK